MPRKICRQSAPSIKRISFADAPKFRYRGGKGSLRYWIARWCQLSGTTYCEPFAGRANMFFLMRLLGGFTHWHLNDLQTASFLRSIQNYDGRLLPTPTREESLRLKRIDPDTFLLLSPNIYWSGGLPDKALLMDYDIKKHKVDNIDNYRDKLLLAKRLLRNTRITDTEAIEVIESYSNDSDSFLYIDPPYLRANVTVYDEKMLNRAEFIGVLQACKCRWLLSEYYCDDLVDAFGEPIATYTISVCAKKRASRCSKRRECLWSNYPMTPHCMNLLNESDPSPKAVRLLRRLGGKADWQAWWEYCPGDWDESYARNQFRLLSRQPWTYFDGIVVSSL